MYIPDCKTAWASSLLVKPFNPAPASTSHATMCDPYRSKEKEEEIDEEEEEEIVEGDKEEIK